MCVSVCGGVCWNIERVTEWEITGIEVRNEMVIFVISTKYYTRQWFFLYFFAAKQKVAFQISLIYTYDTTDSTCVQSKLETESAFFYHNFSTSLSNIYTFDVNVIKPTIGNLPAVSTNLIGTVVSRFLKLCLYLCNGDIAKDTNIFFIVPRYIYWHSTPSHCRDTTKESFGEQLFHKNFKYAISAHRNTMSLHNRDKRILVVPGPVLWLFAQSWKNIIVIFS